MDSKEIKSALKEARDAIKNKDFAASLKICKNILKSDKENYMALVFFGLSLQEVGPRDQAPLAFRKAIVANSEQPLAWNGLANYYEKDDSDDASKELIPIYEKLLDTEIDVSKFTDICNKLVFRAIKVQEISKAADILKRLANNEKNNENNRQTAWLALANLLTQVNNLSPDLYSLFELTLMTVVKERSLVSCDYYKEYLKLLYKLNKYELLFDEAINMHSLYESNIYPLEWLCKVYVELAIENNALVNTFEEKIEKYNKILLELQSDAVMGIFTKGVICFQHKNYIEARDELRKVVSLRSGLTHAWVLLAECLLNLHCYDEASQIAARADKYLNSLNKVNLNLRAKLNRILISAYSKQTNLEKLNQALELASKVLEQHCDDEPMLVCTINVNINLGRYNEAKKLIESLKNNSTLYSFLSSKLLRKQGELNKALDILKSTILDTCEFYIEIGTLYWDLQEYESSLVPFLKAAKLDPNCFMCFVYLGRYYEFRNDTDKARRCYQKAFKINSRCVEAGVGLSNIYRQQKNWEANLELLQSVTGAKNSTGLHFISSDVRWAWLQLGLTYLEQGEYGSAIDSLRAVIRAEPDNGHYWECLADAYMARGAYTAALKSYERTAELISDSLYPKLQVASIKLMLGNYAEASADFEEILSKNKRYVPALKGLAENCLNLAFTYRKEQLLGLARKNAQYSLDQLTLALKERSNLACLWKLTGDCCVLVGSLPEKYCYMFVDSLLAEGLAKEERSVLDQAQLYTLAARCYCKAISLTDTNILLWHDLAMCYYAHGCSDDDIKQRKILLNRALAAAKYCISNNSNSWQHWNLLGVVAVHKDVKNYALAQHAFINAVRLDNNSAVSWCNLGTLYFMLGDIHLANKAFSQAQRGDPGYVNSWVGQALIAESMGHEDAMDLFRHSTQLGHQSQGALGYAHWVCRTIIDAPPHKTIYSIHNMHAIPVAYDAITWYTENHPYDSCALNMLGLLRERMGLKNSAVTAFKKAMKTANDVNYDKLLINCARILVKLEQYDEAIEMYEHVKEASFNGGSGLALALFKAKQYQKSYDSYDTTMNWLAENENLQSHVLVALAAMAYMFKGPDDAKDILLQSTQLKPPSQWGLYALLTLGLLHGDYNLAQLVLKELQPMKDKPDIIYHYSVLHCLTYLIQGDKKGAIRSMTKSVHRHPGLASLWFFLSNILLQVDAKNRSHVAAKCAQVSMKMGRSQMDVSKVLCIVSLATCVSKDIKSALSSAQKAVHCYPDVAEGWAVLISALNLSSSNNTWTRKNEWLHLATKHVTENLNPTKKLDQWLTQMN